MSFLIHFQDKMANLFFFQLKALIRKSVNKIVFNNTICFLKFFNYQKYSNGLVLVQTIIILVQPKQKRITKAIELHFLNY